VHAELLLDLELLVGPHDRLVVGDVAFGQRVRPDVEVGEPDQIFRAGLAGCVREGLVDDQEFSLGVLEPDHVGEVVQHAAQEGLAQLELLLGSPPPADVPHDAHHRDDGAVGIAEGNQTRVDPNRRAVKVVLVLGDQDLAGAKDLLDGLAVALGKPRTEYVSLRAAHHVGGVLAEGPRRRLVDEEHVLLGIHDEDHVRDDLEHRGQPPPACQEELLDLGDVQHGDFEQPS
jgi:hypothetical protein